MTDLTLQSSEHRTQSLVTLSIQLFTKQRQKNYRIANREILPPTCFDSFSDMAFRFD
jgi:hypothetical protein